MAAYPPEDTARRNILGGAVANFMTVAIRTLEIAALRSQDDRRGCSALSSPDKRGEADFPHLIRDR